MKISIEQILSWGPCEEYDTLEKIIAETDDDWPKTPIEIANLGIPTADRLWVLLRPEIISEKRLHLLACDFAEMVLYIFETEYPDDKRPRLVIDIKRMWVAGGVTDAGLDAAWAATLDAERYARDAALTAARAVVHAASAASARDAAWEAAWAAREAAREVSSRALWSSVLKKQLQMVLDVLEGCDD